MSILSLCVYCDLYDCSRLETFLFLQQCTGLTYLALRHKLHVNESLWELGNTCLQGRFAYGQFRLVMAFEAGNLRWQESG